MRAYLCTLVNLALVRLAKLSIFILEGIIKQIWYERCDYESVDDKSLS